MRSGGGDGSNSDSITKTEYIMIIPTAYAGDDFSISCVDNPTGSTFTTGRSHGIGDDANNYPQELYGLMDKTLEAV